MAYLTLKVFLATIFRSLYSGEGLATDPEFVKLLMAVQRLVPARKLSHCKPMLFTIEVTTENTKAPFQKLNLI